MSKNKALKEVAKAVKLTDEEKAIKLLQEKQTEKMNECGKKIEKVLAEYGFQLYPTVTIGLAPLNK